MDLKPYPEARTITLPWLHTVPLHWDVRRIKTLLREHDRRTKTGEERLLSLRMREGIVDHLESGGKPVRPTDLIGYKIVEPGVLIMNRMRASSGLFGVASIGGLVSPDYATFRRTSTANTSYLLYSFKTPMLAEVFRAESRGLGTGEAGFLRLYTDRFGAIEIPVPPIEEQQLIVRYLDAHGVLTARLIRAKQRLIKLLEEQKQAIIHRAVTRGLDRNIRLKPSGIPWLGDIPAHWQIKALKFWTRINKKTLPETTAADFQFSYVDIGCVTTGRLLRSPEAYTFTNAPSRARRILSKGDTILSTVRTYLKAILFIDDPLDGSICSTGFTVMSPTDAVHPRYLGYLLQSSNFTDRVSSLSVGEPTDGEDLGEGFNDVENEAVAA
jgi:type I restriction enzyme S subunit